jgi:hypothetical protein
MENVIYIEKDELRGERRLGQELLGKLLGGLPETPRTGLTTHAQAVLEKIPMKKTGEPYQTRYDLGQEGAVKLPGFDEFHVLLNYETDDEGKKLGQFDQLAYVDGPQDEQGNVTPNPVIATLEFYKGKWYALFHLRWRQLMKNWGEGWMADFPGGRLPVGETTESGAWILLEKTFGKGEILHMQVDSEAFITGNRAVNANPAFTFLAVVTGEWERSTDPGGYQIIDRQWFAIPLESRIQIPDALVNGAFSYAQSCWEAGDLKAFEK